MTGRVVALCGGVGGAKLALGLARVVPPGALSVIVNTGDDFDHLGLRVCPDLDTVTYTLAGLADPVQGWGLAGETRAFMSALTRLGGEDWFMLGDQDLATHVSRSWHLARGGTLTGFAAEMARRLGVDRPILPMSDQPVRTVVATDVGDLPFQDYFVRRRCAPSVRAIRYAGAAEAAPAPDALAALTRDDLELIVICPSNPWLSIGPMLAMPALRAAIEAARCPVVSVSPIVGGAAVKGPTAKIMAELGLEVTARAVADYYGPLVDGHLIDERDAGEIGALRRAGWMAEAAPTLMSDTATKTTLAARVLRFGQSLRAAAP